MYLAITGADEGSYRFLKFKMDIFDNELFLFGRHAIPNTIVSRLYKPQWEMGRRKVILKNQDFCDPDSVWGYN